MLITVLAIATIALTLLALNHVATRPTDRDVAPVPTFSQPARDTPSPSPSETTAPVASYDRSQERFLTASAGMLWRGTAGQCGVIEPLLERSADGGQTWTDVTPRYIGIGQLVALNPFADGQAEIVALMGTACELQALRTFTQGQFWDSYPDVLAASQYIDPAEPNSVVRQGSSTTTPCADARSLGATGPVLATNCEGTAYTLGQDDEWLALPATNVAALTVDGDDIVVAHVSEQCDGVTVTRYVSTSETGELHHVGCAVGTESGTPTAIAVADEDVLIWSGTTMALVSR